MPKPHTVHAAKTQLSRLLARAARGEDVVIARGSQPVARPVAVGARTPKREFGAMRGRARVTADFFEPLSEAELRAWGE